MPAIDPARLRQQAALLAESYDDPAAFIRSLNHLLESYADRARRPGQSGQPAPLTPSFKVRPPVLRQIERELIPLARTDPANILALADALWQHPYLEPRLIATKLLGKVPVDLPEVIIEMVERWLDSRPEASLVDALIENGLESLRREQPERMISLTQSWLNSEDILLQQVGLETLCLLIADPLYVNLPVFFRMIQPWARTIPSRLRVEVRRVVECLARRSPQETAFFLRQALALPQSNDTAWLIRQTLHAFPPEFQERLRAAVRVTSRQ